MNEILDIVNDNDVVIGQMTREEIYKRKLISCGAPNFRAINCFLINDKGQLWIPRRTKSKITFPDCLDASVAGHVETGETYEEAFKRELKEELNIEPESINYKFIAKLTPQEHNTSAFIHVFLIHTNQVPDYNKNDFYEYYWFTPEELLERIVSGDKSKSDLPKIVKACYKYLT